MSIADIVTRGYGSFGSISDIVTRGYSIGVQSDNLIDLDAPTAATLNAVTAPGSVTLNSVTAPTAATLNPV